MSVKRKLFIDHLRKNGCYLHRNGANHDIYQNSITKKKTSIPRHPHLDKNLCNLICKQLEIPKL
jgi:predicted RNA binding protein YcfA (HicA-like mRNA interferase family)